MRSRFQARKERVWCYSDMFVCQGIEHFCKTCYCAFLFFSKKCLFGSFAHLLVDIFVLCSYNFHSPLYSLDFNPLSEVKIFNQVSTDLCAV